MHDRGIRQAYETAREVYGGLGVDTDTALNRLTAVPLSLHCWQGDDVSGFERPDTALSGGGLVVTGAYPGRARTLQELRGDLHFALSLIPGHHRVNLHAIYGDFGGRPVDRDAVAPEHFAGWIEWARAEGVALDFNATCFSHPLAASGFTLSHSDESVRNFWVEHVKRCRAISAFIGRSLGSPCLHNLWIPDGAKENPVDRWSPRLRLRQSLDEIYAVDHRPEEMKDSLESKLFGIGSESYVVGSHEFYLAYALARKIMLCLDLGHFHPTESVSDKLSALLQFFPEVLLHISRGVRWDSDHVVVLDDELRSLCREVVRPDLLGRVHFALDFFDASLNRVGAWVIGGRSVLKALLMALLEPVKKLRRLEAEGRGFERLAWEEETKTLPSGAVWDYYCIQHDVPAGPAWVESVKAYERDVLSKR